MKVFRFREVGRFEGLFWSYGTYVDNVLVMLDRETWMKRNLRVLEQQPGDS